VKYSFHPEAEAQFVQAIDYYEGIEGQTLFIGFRSWSSLLHHVYDSSSVRRTSQMNPSLCSGRSVIVCLRFAVVSKDRLVIIPSLPHMIRVAGCNGSDNPWHARS
jgi:hypothetical protein